MTEQAHRRIGIMADSHGNAQLIHAAAVYLKGRGCERICHLGDICDTNRPDTADACVAQVKDHGMVAVRGNNDHSLAADARGRRGGGIRPETLSFLENLPLALTVAGAELVHSRPFVRELGLSAMIGTLGRRDAERYFRETPDALLFRGHSHRPEMIHRVAGTVRFAALTAGQSIDLSAQRPCIVTCGALTSDFVLVWNPLRNSLNCESFR